MAWWVDRVLLLRAGGGGDRIGARRRAFPQRRLLHAELDREPAEPGVFFLTLNAIFVATIQVLIYAGAVMVLFLFVVTMLSPEREQR